jgi:putative ATPase subunit gpP of terminase
MTRRSSQRALAREIYRKMVKERARQEAAPTPDPSLLLASARGGGETGPAAQNLTEKVRALYEHSAVPVAEIARLAGVTERTIYKYAARENWTPRYRWSCAGSRPRGACWRAAAALAPVKGAGGRFIRRADKGKPFAAGLKATDPAAAAAAAAACRREEAASRAAQQKAKEAQHAEAEIRAIDTVSRTLHELNRYLAERDKAPSAAPSDARVEHLLMRAVELAAERWEWLQAHPAGEY